MGNPIVTDLWTAGASGLWSNGADWSLGAPPTASEAVEILGPATVTYSGGVSAIAGLQLEAATLDLASGVLTDTGAAQFNYAILGGGGTLVVDGQASTSGLTVNATLDLTGAQSIITGAVTGTGTLEIGGGSVALESVTALSVAHWTLAGGETDAYGNLTYADAFAGEAGATLVLDGAVTLTGAASISGLFVEGQGAIVLQGASAVSGATLAAGVQLDDLGGSITQKGGNVDFSSGDGLVVANGGVWDIADASGLLGGPSTLLIGNTTNTATTGLFEKTGAGVSVVQTNVINNEADAGSVYQGVEVSAGTLDFQGAVTAVNGASKIGSDNIVGAGTLEFDGSVANQAVAFFGSGGTLDLNDLAAFHASISGFDTTGSHDSLLIGGGYQFAGAHETATSATLSFTRGGATTTLTLTGDYEHACFHARTLAGGVLDISA